MKIEMLWMEMKRCCGGDGDPGGGDEEMLGVEMEMLVVEKKGEYAVR